VEGMLGDLGGGMALDDTHGGMLPLDLRETGQLRCDNVLAYKRTWHVASIVSFAHGDGACYGLLWKSKSQMKSTNTQRHVHAQLFYSYPPGSAGELRPTAQQHLRTPLLVASPSLCCRPSIAIGTKVLRRPIHPFQISSPSS
jgi:hypothetical protein